MMSMRASTAGPQRRLVEQKPKRGEANVAWLTRAEIEQGVVLLGGATLADVRVRFAQSLLRHDLTPVLVVAALLARARRLTVPLDAIGDPVESAAANAYPALAARSLSTTRPLPERRAHRLRRVRTGARDAAADVGRQRGLIDLPGLLVGVARLDLGRARPTPAARRAGVPSAAFVEVGPRHRRHRADAGARLRLELPRGDLAVGPLVERLLPRIRADRVCVPACSPDAGHAQPSVPAGAFAIRSRTRATAADQRQGGSTDDRPGGRALRRHRRRLRVRWVGDDLPAARGGQTSACSSAARPIRPGTSRAPEPSGARSGIRARAATGCTTPGGSTTSGRVVSSGLGGGSLIYANVMLRKDADRSSTSPRRRKPGRSRARTSSRTTTAPRRC